MCGVPEKGLSVEGTPPLSESPQGHSHSPCLWGAVWTSFLGSTPFISQLGNQRPWHQLNEPRDLLGRPSERMYPTVLFLKSSSIFLSQLNWNFLYEASLHALATWVQHSSRHVAEFVNHMGPQPLCPRETGRWQVTFVLKSLYLQKGDFSLNSWSSSKSILIFYLDDKVSSFLQDMWRKSSLSSLLQEEIWTYQNSTLLRCIREVRSQGKPEGQTSRHRTPQFTRAETHAWGKPP